MVPDSILQRAEGMMRMGARILVPEADHRSADYLYRWFSRLVARDDILHHEGSAGFVVEHEHTRGAVFIVPCTTLPEFTAGRRFDFVYINGRLTPVESHRLTTLLMQPPLPPLPVVPGAAMEWHVTPVRVTFTNDRNPAVFIYS